MKIKYPENTIKNYMYNMIWHLIQDKINQIINKFANPYEDITKINNHNESDYNFEIKIDQIDIKFIDLTQINNHKSNPNFEIIIVN